MVLRNDYEINYVDQIVVFTTGPASFIIKCQCQGKTQITDCRQTMICRLDTRGEMQCYFHYQVLTIKSLKIEN